MAIGDPHRWRPSVPRSRGRVEFQDVHLATIPRCPCSTASASWWSPGQRWPWWAGPTGKSTIINLLPRVYEITGGGVLIDEHDIQHVTVESLRAQVGS